MCSACMVCKYKYFYFFAELKKFKRYQIVMTSYNIIGESPPSTPVEVSVGEAGRWKQKEAVGLVTLSMCDVLFVNVYTCGI